MMMMMMIISRDSVIHQMTMIRMMSLMSPLQPRDVMSMRGRNLFPRHPLVVRVMEGRPVVPWAGLPPQIT
jgi:hypothetical protein